VNETACDIGFFVAHDDPRQDDTAHNDDDHESCDHFSGFCRASAWPVSPARVFTNDP
jgi:hypothetical protein